MPFSDQAVIGDNFRVHLRLTGLASAPLASRTSTLGALLPEHELLHLVLHGRDRVVGRTEPGDGLALLVDDKLGEVPLDGAEDRGVKSLRLRNTIHDI